MDSDSITLLQRAERAPSPAHGDGRLTEFARAHRWNDRALGRCHARARRHNLELPASHGKVGLWIGPGTRGYFSRMVITPRDAI